MEFESRYLAVGYGRRDIFMFSFFFAVEKGGDLLFLGRCFQHLFVEQANELGFGRVQRQKNGGGFP